MKKIKMNKFTFYIDDHVEIDLSCENVGALEIKLTQLATFVIQEEGKFGKIIKSRKFENAEAMIDRFIDMEKTLSGISTSYRMPSYGGNSLLTVDAVPNNNFSVGDPIPNQYRIGDPI